jgi:hypothetical protein
MTPRDLIGRLDVLHVECRRCDRHGRYPVEQLAIKIGLDARRAPRAIGSRSRTPMRRPHSVSSSGEVRTDSCPSTDRRLICGGVPLTLDLFRGRQTKSRRRKF